MKLNDKHIMYACFGGYVGMLVLLRKKDPERVSVQ